MKPGFIAELCIPEDADGARRVRRELVDELKEQKLFSKVDLLSDDLRRHLADPKVVIPDRNFVLALDFCRNGVPASPAAQEAAAGRSVPGRPQASGASLLDFAREP